MVRIYYAKLQNRLPGGLSELAWRLCIYAIRQEIFPQDSDVDTLRQLDDLIDRDTRGRLIGHGDRGKPFLKEEILRAAGRERAWYFNLSHSGEYAVCATSDARIGCDIQRIGSERKKVAERFFHESEREYIAQASGAAESAMISSQEERDHRFTRVWTMRESYVKMTGEGIGIMQDFYIGLSGEEACVYRKKSVLSGNADAAYSESPAAFRQAEIDPDYSCTVCCENSAVFDASVPCFNLTGVLE